MVCPAEGGGVFSAEPDADADTTAGGAGVEVEVEVEGLGLGLAGAFETLPPLVGVGLALEISGTF